MKTTPLMTLPCIGTQVELYRDCVVIHHTGWLPRLLHRADQDQTIRVNEIRSLSLFQDHPLLNGTLIIRVGRGKSAYVVYSQNYFHTAREFYLALDDLRTRKDVLSVIRAMSAS